jgi:predicted alpha/beta-hydrolase family hydrolase
LNAPPNVRVGPFVDSEVEPQVRGHIHQPEDSIGDGLILTHGAGSNSRAPLLVALAEALSSAGFTVLRCDLPYRQVRAYGPPRPGDAAPDREGLKNAVAAMRKLVHGRVFLGGHSYGGRQSSMLCANEPDLVDGLLLLSYPLHPPRKPEQLRTQHLANLRTPSLFVSGTRDPFGSVEEIENALKLTPARTRLLTVEGGGHDLNYAKGRIGDGSGLVLTILKSFQEFFSKIGNEGQEN